MKIEDTKTLTGKYMYFINRFLAQVILLFYLNILKCKYRNLSNEILTDFVKSRLVATRFWQDSKTVYDNRINAV